VRGLTTTILLVLVLAGLGGYIYFVENRKPAGGADAKAKAFDVAADQIEEIQVKVTDGDATRIKRADKAWKLVEPVEADGDNSEITNMASTLASLDVQSVVDEAPGDLKQFGQLRFTIIPPESNKRYDQGVFKRLWYQAGQALHRASTLVVIGYSFPLSDSHATALFRVSTKEVGLKSLVLVNPDRDARRRAREVLKRGLSSKTKVLVFDTFKEFAAVDRDLWNA